MRILKLRLLWVIVLIICGNALNVMAMTSTVGPFTFKISTGNIMTLLIAKANNPTINDAPIGAGDIIAVYTPAGLCVGASRCTDTGNVAIVVWGDDTQTPVIDGAKSTDTLTFRIFDFSANLIGNATVTWIPSGTGVMTQAYTYAASAIGGLASFAGSVLPGAVTLTAPLSGATTVGVSPTLSWVAGTGTAADKYLVKVSTSSNFSSLIINDSTPVTSYSIIAPLDSEKIYYWSIAGKNDGGTGVWTSDSFVTMTAPTHFVFTSFTGNSMSLLVQRSISPTVNGVPLSVGDEIGVFTQAGLCVGAKRWNGSSNVSIPVWGDNDQTLQLDGAVYGDSLLFRVWDMSAAKEIKATVTWQPVGAGQFSGAYIYAINTEAGLTGFAAQLIPDAPILSSPSNTSEGITVTPTLLWTSVSNTTSYRVQVSTSSTFGTTVVDDSLLTIVSKDISTALEYNKIYYWRVNAKNISSTGVWSVVWSFTTKVGNPILTFPANNATGVDINPTLTWETITGATSYHIQLSLTSNFSSQIFEDSTLVSGSQPLTALTKNTEYFWRVRAKNSGGVSSWVSSSFTTINSFALTISATNGSVAKSPDLTSYDSNAVVQLTATPATGYTFTGWTGDASETTNPISVTMNGAKSITATFAIKSYTLTIVSPNGTVAKTPDLTSYDSNSVVGVKVTPAVGYSFIGWTGDIESSTDSISVTMNAAKSITAVFMIKKYILTTTAVNGTVGKSPNLVSYDTNSVVELTATPASGYAFNGWTGDASGTTNPISVTMNAAKNITANFIALNVVELVSGWNMFSLNVIPQDSNATAVFGSMTHLVIVKSGDGKVFWPEFGINTIGTVHLGQAYQVYTNGADVISVTGTPVVLSSTPIPLASGWNMLAYLPKVDMPIVTALAGIVSQIKIVKNNAGEVYWPDYGIDDINIMQVGQGYMMNMKTTGSLTYPSGLGKQAYSTSGTIMPKTRHFVYIAGNTGSNATVLATRIVQSNKNVSDSSEVGVYNASGNLAGSGVVMNGKAAFAIWGDNPMTKEKDGLAPSESFTFKLWRANGEVNDLVFVGEGADKGFVENGLIVGAMSVRSNNLVMKFALANAYPNPFRGNVRIAFDVASINGKDLQNVEINVFDVRGVLVQQIVKGMYKAGHYTVAWDGNDHLGSNMYIIQMKAEEFSQKIKLFRVK